MLSWSGAPRAILHLDADAFFAAVEQRDDPRLRGRPVAVGTGVVASCSYEARRYGVRTAMRLAEACRLCRSLVVVPGAYPRYEQVARQLLAMCRDHTPCVEVAALDDLYLDLTHSGKSTPDRTAAEVRTQVREQMQLSVSVGMGASKLVARVATAQAKPGRQVQVPPGTEQEYLAPWPVTVLPGAGGKVQRQLDRLRVRQVGQVAAMPERILRGLFGPRGSGLHRYAQGIDLRQVEPDRQPQSISRRTSFDPPVSELGWVRALLRYLLERATSWMRFRGLAARGVTLTLRYGDDDTVEGREPITPATQRDDVLWEAASERLGRLWTRRLPLRLLGMALTPVTPAVGSESLFPDPDAERARRLLACKDAIRGRFGFMALCSGDLLPVTKSTPHDRTRLQLRTPCLTR
jgi:DNA polymerase-4